MEGRQTTRVHRGGGRPDRLGFQRGPHQRAQCRARRTRIDVEEIVRSFLLATRGTAEPQDPRLPLARIYAEQFNVCAAIMRDLVAPEKLPPVRLHITYSQEAKAETLRLGDGSIVIYDQYLGQVFSQLNRLVVKPTSFRAITCYLFKICANLSLINGYPQEAMDYGLMHLRLRPQTADGYQPWSELTDPIGFHDAPEPERQPRFRFTEQDRGAFSFLQEAFVLCHELAHHLLRARSLAALTARRRLIECFELGRTYHEIMREDGRIGDPVRRADALLSDWIILHQRMFGRAPTPTEIQREVDHMASQSDERDVDVARLLADPGMAEECLCDLFAADVVGQLARSIGKRHGDGVLASFMALHWMRLIRTLAVAAPRVARDDAQEVTPTDLAGEHARLQIFRRTAVGLRGRGFMGARTLLDASGLDGGGRPESRRLTAMHQHLQVFHLEMSDFNRQYWDRLGDYVERYFLAAASVELQDLRAHPRHQSLDLPPDQAIIIARWACDMLGDRSPEEALRAYARAALGH
ncbi:hypothetical protein AB0J82_15730 [Asanoa sp. NPDC049518]|uniref:hypothetical protein n=1 Tax=unclassified Asanoa TaxID=2685164 RepID=UPI003442C470